MYFLPNTVGGDGDDTWPHPTKFDTKTRYDLSKLAQWETVFRHAQSRGIFLHFVLAETEPGNENYYDDGDLGVQRKLYFREMIARFSHHPGVQYNIGEENDFGTSGQKAHAERLKALEPYDHAVTTHTHNNDVAGFYDPLVGYENIDLTSWQLGDDEDSLVDKIVRYREESASAGRPWIVSIDEPQGIHNDHDDTNRGLPHARMERMWPAFASGAGGFEWYLQGDGGGHTVDRNIDDMSEMEPALRYAGIAAEYLMDFDLGQFDPDPGLVDGGWALDGGDEFICYHEDGGSPGALIPSGEYEVEWLNPRTGDRHGRQTVTTSGSLPAPPFDGDAVYGLFYQGDSSSSDGDTHPTYEIETSDLSTAEEVEAMAETVVSGPEKTDPDSPTTDYLVRGTYTEDAINQIEGMSGVESVTRVSR
jgi:hypothetical protein